MRAVIVAERWQSWAYTLRSLRWSSLNVFVKDLNLTTKFMFKKELGLKILPYNESLSSRNLFEKDVVFWWIQGSETFYREIEKNVQNVWILGYEILVVTPVIKVSNVYRKWSRHPT